MRDWNSLIQTVRSFLKTRCVFPETIKPALREKFQQHNAHTLTMLEAILHADIDDHDKINRLQLFLSARWNLIMHTSVDYTFHPNFPANLACFYVATAIAGEEKAVCQILMPTIQKIIGSGVDGHHLKEASESPKGTFPLHGFLTNVHGDLISILELYEYATINPDYFFDDQFGLTELDRHHLKICAGNASIILFEMIRKNYLNKHSKKESLGTLLRELITALYKSSKKESGNEYQASRLEALPAIHAFHAYWKSMPDDSRNRARYLRVKGATLSLESFLLCLFVRAKLDVTSEEFERVERERIMPCAHDISQQLDTLLNENIHLLCELTLSDVDTNAAHAESKPDFEAQMERLLEAVAHRAPIAGFTDQRFFYQQPLEHFTCYHLTNEAYIMHLNATISRIKNVAELSAALCFIPESFWAYFAEALTTTHQFHFSEARDEVSNTQYLLEQLRESQWTSFFQAFHTVIPHWIDSVRLARIAVSFKGKKREAFKEGIHSFLPQLLANGVKVAGLFLEQQDPEFTVLFQLFGTYIENIVVRPQECVDFFSVLHQEGVPITPLLKLLAPMLKRQLQQDSNYLFSVLKLFSNVDCSLTFLKSFTIAHPDLIMNREGLVWLLRHYDIRYYGSLLSAISSILTNLIATPQDLSALLMTLIAGEERDLFLFHLTSHIQFSNATALTVYIILKQFPHCEHLLLEIFEPSLKTILNNLLENLTSHEKLGLYHSSSDEVFKLFDFFVEKALPVILSNDYLKDHLMVWTVYELSKDNISSDAGFLVYRQLIAASPAERLKIMVTFINAQASLLLHRTSAFYRELIENFGENFFQQLLRLHERRNVVLLQSSFVNQGFFGSDQHRAPHPVLAARVVNAAPEPIGMTPPPSPR